MKHINIPQSVSQHRDAWLWRPIFKRVNLYNKMFSGIWVGEPGSGKSFGALSICDLLDRGENDVGRFNMSRVCFSASQFAEVVGKDLPRGSAILIDDAGLSLCSRESMTRIVIQIAKIFQSIRYRNLIIFLTLPSMGSLDKNVRELLNSYFEPTKINFDVRKTRVKFHRLQTNPKSGKIYSHKPKRLVVSKYPDGFTKKAYVAQEAIWIDAPRPDLVEEYEIAKKLYLDDWNQRNIKTIKDAESGKKKAKRSTFAEYYAKVSAKKSLYYTPNKFPERISAARIVLRHKGCGIRNAELIARDLNAEMRGCE